MPKHPVSVLASVVLASVVLASVVLLPCAFAADPGGGPDDGSDDGSTAPAAPSAPSASEDAEDTEDTEDTEDAPATLPADRVEWALIPNFGSTPDLGFILGIGGITSRFKEGYDPYKWKHVYYLNASVKEGPEGTEYPYALVGIESDFPGLFGGWLRLYPTAWHMRRIDFGYYGIGNATGDELPSTLPPELEEGRYFQYKGEETVVEFDGRFELGRTDFIAGVKFRHVAPVPYPGSKLAEDIVAASPELYGTGDHTLLQAAIGAIWDTRDDETVPTQGSRHTLSVRVGSGLDPGSDIRYGGVNASSRSYRSLGSDGKVLAARARADLLFGNVPFYELSRGSSFGFMEMPAGPSGIRGVPAGRLAGKIKFVTSVEYRSRFFSLRSLSPRNLSAVVFADAGRVWADYDEEPDLDGSGPGVTYGAGVGLHGRWGKSILVRAELAYSPDAVEEGGLAPFGLYILIKSAF